MASVGLEVDAPNSDDATSFEKLRGQLRREQEQRHFLEVELKAEKETIEQLLNQMDNLELEARAANEEKSSRERTLESDLLLAQRALDDERSIRLQHLYELSRAREEVEISRTDVKKLNDSVQSLQAGMDSQEKHIESLEASLKASKRITEQYEFDLRTIAGANLTHKQDTHVLRNRLVEAEAEITRWRQLYEDAVATAARERNEMGKIYHKQRVGERSNGAATMGKPPARPSESRKPNAPGSGEFPSLGLALPPASRW
jgi:chromosome segregation ATPase